MQGKRMDDIVDEIGSRSKNLDAEEVVIKTRDGDLVIRNPEIAVSRILGRDVYQIVGDVSKDVAEVKRETKSPTEKPETKSEIEDDLERILKGLRETVKDAEERK